MPINFPPPERCLLVQAVHWFVDRTRVPLPDDVYRRAPVEVKTENSELRELFLALQLADCEMRGDIRVDFVKYEINPFHDDTTELERVWSDIGSNQEIDDFYFDKCDFKNGSIKIDPFIITGDSWKLYTEDRHAYPPEEGWESEFYFANVTVNFSKLSAFLSEAKERAPPPDRRGAPQKYNWDQIWAEIAVCGDLDNLPETQAKCISWISQWCIDRYGDAPSETTLKEKLKLVYRHPKKVGK